MYKILIALFIGSTFISSAHASLVCTKFNLNAPNEQILSPIKIKNLYISESILESAEDQTKFLLDYSDGKNLVKKHAFTDCSPLDLKANKRHYVCNGDGYQFNLDLSSRKNPQLHLNFFSLIPSGSKNFSVKANHKNNNISIEGIYVKCPEEPKDLIIINSF
jgi:hypothetical protein